MILLGSRALEYYFSLNRPLHDWDFLMSQEEIRVFDLVYKPYFVKKTAYSLIYDIKGEIVEIRNPFTLDATDKELLNKEFPHKKTTPFGFARVPDIQTLYDVKKSTAFCIDEPKHHYDLNLFDQKSNIYQLDSNTEFFRNRLNETKIRCEKSKKVKYDFFHKLGHLPEYILHDRLHDLYADLLDLNIPTYQRITTAETNISEELFNQLTHQQKISLMVEETLVLNLERWFVPQMVENGINHRLIDMFYNNNEAMPTYQILKHVCITGLKGEADYITNFARANFFEIEKEWILAKQKIRKKHGFPQWFFTELFQLRSKYRNGEKVGFHHKPSV